MKWLAMLDSYGTRVYRSISRTKFFKPTLRPTAAPLLTYYAEIVAPKLRGHGDDRQHVANYAMCFGMFKETRPNRARAEEAYLHAFGIYREAGLLRRASIVAYRLLVLTGDPTYEDFITEALRDASRGVLGQTPPGQQ